MKHRSNLDFNVIVTSTYDDGGVLEWQVAPIGYSEDGTPGSTIPGEAYHPFGFQGRPQDADQPTTPDPDGCKVLVFGEGSVQHTIALDDARVTALMPQLAKGASRQYDKTGANALFDGSGNWTLDLSASQGTCTIKVGGGVQIVVNAQGVQINGVSPAAPVQVGQGTPTPVILGASAGAWGKPSTILFAGA